MSKDDAHRLKRLIKLLMIPTYSGLSGRDMIEFTGHLEWLAKMAEDLEKPAMKFKGPPKPIKDKG